MRAIILAGGLGTRLREVVGDRPKPMADIRGKPFLEYQIDQLRAHGFLELVVCAGYRAELIQDYFSDGSRFGVRIDYVVERELLGTAGALRNADRFVDSTFVTMNGDSYLETDLSALVAFHQARRLEEPEMLGTLAAVTTDNASALGRLELERGGRIAAFEEKMSAAPGWVNAGVYVFERAILDAIPRGETVSLERQTLPAVLAEGKRLFAYQAQGVMIDIGTPTGYARFTALAGSAAAAGRSPGRPVS